MINPITGKQIGSSTGNSEKDNTVHVTGITKQYLGKQNKRVKEAIEQENKNSPITTIEEKTKKLFDKDMEDGRLKDPGEKSSEQFLEDRRQKNKLEDILSLATGSAVYAAPGGTKAGAFLTGKYFEENVENATGQELETNSDKMLNDAVDASAEAGKNVRKTIDKTVKNVSKTVNNTVPDVGAGIGNKILLAALGIGGVIVLFLLGNLFDIKIGDN